jgi:copper(I)-binding protein
VKSAIFAPLALASAALCLTACDNHRQQDSKPFPPSSRGTPAPGIPATGISVSDARLVLPAVPGNPGAVYFTVHNDTDSPATLDEVKVEGAKSAMLHDMSMAGGHMEMNEVKQMDVPARGELVFAPGGRHVMAMHLADSLKPGGPTTVTLTFANGQRATLPAEILAVGNAH